MLVAGRATRRPVAVNKRTADRETSTKLDLVFCMVSAGRFTGI